MLYTKYMITAVDVGATKTLVAQFKGDSLEPVSSVRFETPSIAADFERLLTRHLQDLGEISVISMGVPGQMSDDGQTVLYCGNLPWRNVPLKDMLARTYNCPIFIENDAAMAGLSEINALSPLPKLGLYITLGTGIGSAFILNGRLQPGLNRSEAGHMVLKADDTTWREWEDMVSGHAIFAQFHTLAKDITAPQQWQWIAEHLAQGLSPLIAALMPQVVVFGGGVGHYFERFEGYLAEKLARRLPDFIPKPTLHGAIHAEEAVLYGCYYHAIHQRVI